MDKQTEAVSSRVAQDLYPVALQQARRAFLVTAAKGFCPIVAVVSVALGTGFSGGRSAVIGVFVSGLVFVILPWALGTRGAWRAWRTLKHFTPEEAARAGLL